MGKRNLYTIILNHCICLIVLQYAWCEVSSKSCDAQGNCLSVDCEDNHENCGFWSSQGECESNSVYMLQQCPLSCGMCSDEEDDDEPCEDLHVMCSIWAEEGECEINPAFMHSACRQSCIICLDVEESRENGESVHSIMKKKKFLQMKMGVTQKHNTGTASQNEKTKEIIRKMDYYAKNTVTEPEYDTVRKICTNRNGLCASWSSLGKCNTSPEQMMKVCPLACFACDKVGIFQKCHNKEEHEDDSIGLISKIVSKNYLGWKPFEPKIVYPPHTDEFVFKGDESWVIQLDNFSSKSETRNLQKTSEKLDWTDVETENDKENMVRYESKVSLCNDESLCYNDKDVVSILDRVSDLLSIPQDHFEHVRFEKYSPTNSHGIHSIYNPHDQWKPAGPKALTLLLWLSDVEEGGSIGFPELDWLFVKPKRGRALLWSNVLNNDPKDENKKMVHEILPVVKGQMHLAYVSIHLKNWQVENDRGCT